MKGGTFASQINKTKIVSKVLKTGAFFRFYNKCWGEEIFFPHPIFA